MAFGISYSLENLLEDNAAENGPIMLPDEIVQSICLW